MSAKVISKAQFKAKALSILRDIEQKGDTVIITHYGKPVAKIVQYTDEHDDALSFFKDSVVSYQSPLAPVGEDDWEED